MNECDKNPNVNFRSKTRAFTVGVFATRNGGRGILESTGPSEVPPDVFAAVKVRPFSESERVRGGGLGFWKFNDRDILIVMMVRV